MNHPCCVCDSDKPSVFYKETSKYYCGKHLMQMRRHGRILDRTCFDRNEIILFNDFAEILLYDKNQNVVGKTIIDIDDVDKCSEHKWFMKLSKSNKPYAQRRTGRLHLHHFVIDFNKDKSFEVDHINGNSLDNRKENLRVVTHKENMRNQRVLPSNNTSGYIGITWNPRNNNWNAQIKVDGKMIHLGSFYNINDGIQARKDAELKYFGRDKPSNFE